MAKVSDTQIGAASARNAALQFTFTRDQIVSESAGIDRFMHRYNTTPRSIGVPIVG